MELKDISAKRKGEFAKNPDQENFLEQMNAALEPLDKAAYQDYPIEHPFFFVIGLPRSGTTFTTQFLANAFNLSYVNNLAARFYKAPLQGLKLSEQLLGPTKTSFKSNYASTPELGDIHEFGYFWRYWLKKGSLEAVARAQQDEAHIDWKGLKVCLASLQHHWGNASVFKNIFGSYHLPRLNQLLQNMVVVHVTRDPLDAAVSIYKARKKYYGDDISQWWSYSPPEVLDLVKLDPLDQIAGQVFYLRKFYAEQLRLLPQEKVIELEYQQITQAPGNTARQIQEQVKNGLGYELTLQNDLPKAFTYRTNQADEELRDIFKEKLSALEKSQGL